jgi:hypothetical protein
MTRFYSLTLLCLLAACAGTAPRPRDEEAQACLARLELAGVRYAPAPMPASADGCTIANPVRVTAAAIPWNQPGLVDCGFALRLEAFAREDVEGAAIAQFHQPVLVIHHLGTYACRRENGGHHRWSQHAAGLAIDIAGFELADGTVISVARDWRPPGPKHDFLHRVAVEACARFSVVLTPDSDRDHYKHIHLDAGPYRLCGERGLTPVSSRALPAARGGAATGSAGSGPIR